MNMSQTALRAELELVFLCARTQIDAETKRRIRTLLEDRLDWEYLLQLAFRHGVMPLLCRSLETVGADLAPQRFMKELARAFHANRFHNIFLARELIAIVEELKSRGIESLPYKGPVLALSAYQDLALRQFGDLDILIAKEQMSAAKDALSLRGYHAEYELEPQAEKEFIDTHHDFPMMRSDGRVVVEIQWAITEWSFRIPARFDYFRQRAKPLRVLGADLLNLKPEADLIALSVHASIHCWDRLIWVSDVAELLRSHPDLNWPEALAEARRLGTQRMVFVGLSLCRDLLGTILPENVVEMLERDAVVRALATEAGERLLRDQTREEGSREEMAFHYRLRERLQDKIRFLCHRRGIYLRLCTDSILTPTPADRQVIRLPDSLSALYFVIRPFRLLYQHGIGTTLRDLGRVLGRGV